MKRITACKWIIVLSITFGLFFQKAAISKNKKSLFFTFSQKEYPLNEVDDFGKGISSRLKQKMVFNFYRNSRVLDHIEFKESFTGKSCDGDDGCHAKPIWEKTRRYRVTKVKRDRCKHTHYYAVEEFKHNWVKVDEDQQNRYPGQLQIIDRGRSVCDKHLKYRWQIQHADNLPLHKEKRWVRHSYYYGGPKVDTKAKQKPVLAGAGLLRR